MDANFHPKITPDRETPSTHSSIVCARLLDPGSHNGRMRVIAGTYRSRPLSAPRGDLTRPTSDRLRETLFDIIAPRVPGCRFADLYAGSGAIGIEALSRGAAHVSFAEKAAPAVAAIRANLTALKIATGVDIEPRGTASLLERLAKSGPTTALDLVFLDPPWDLDAEYSTTLSFLGSKLGSAILAPDALVIAEHSSRKPLPDRCGVLTQARTRKQGDAALTFYALA